MGCSNTQHARTAAATSVAQVCNIFNANYMACFHGMNFDTHMQLPMKTQQGSHLFVFCSLQHSPKTTPTSQHTHTAKQNTHNSSRSPPSPSLQAMQHNIAFTHPQLHVIGVAQRPKQPPPPPPPPFPNALGSPVMTKAYNAHKQTPPPTDLNRGSGETKRLPQTPAAPSTAAFSCGISY